MIVAFVVAMAENGVIGRAASCPGACRPTSSASASSRFGKPVIMGRKTYESIGKPLDGRDNIVVTRRTDFSPPGVHVAATIAEALALGRSLAGKRGVDEVMVIGGAEVFRAPVCR